MYRKSHNGQHSIADLNVPFGGTLDPDNRWVVFSSLMPWEELENTYAPHSSPQLERKRKPVRLAFGALFIKQLEAAAEGEEWPNALNATGQGSLRKTMQKPHSS